LSAEIWIPIRYREFYDFPRSFVISHNGENFLFDCAFDDAIDEYPNLYQIYALDAEQVTRLHDGSWAPLADPNKQIGTAPTSAVQFDSTRRGAVEASSP